MTAVALRVELHLPTPQSLKAKRSIVQSIVRTLDGWAAVGAAEVDHQELWQRTAIEVVVVGVPAMFVEERADAVERFVWSRPDVEVLDISWTWLE